MWFAIDTLEYLRRGGRIGGARAWIGAALKIKPILTLEEEITPIERVRTRARSIERLRDYARQRHEDGLDAWMVQHIQGLETAEALVEDCREIFGCEPVFVSEIGAVLGAHVGPGMLGVGSTRGRSSSRALTGGGAAPSGRRSQSPRRPRRSARAMFANLPTPVGQLGDPVAKCSTELPRSWRWTSISRRISAAGRPGIPDREAADRGRESRAQPLLLPFDRLPDQLRLFDRLSGIGGAPALTAR